MAIGMRRSSKLRVSAKIAAAMILALALAPHQPLAQDVRSHDEAAKILTLENLSVTDGKVTGDAVNRSPNTLRDVQILIRHIWLWDRETKPGTNDPSTSTYYSLGKDIPRSGRVPFTYAPATPLAKMPGGHFETTVTVAAYTEVIAQAK